MKTPNVTQAQVGALLAALAAVVATVQAAPERLQVPLLVAVAGIVVAWIVADAVIRHGRAGIEAARVAAAPALPADALDAALPEVVKLAPADGDDQAAHAPEVS